MRKALSLLGALWCGARGVDGTWELRGGKGSVKGLERNHKQEGRDGRGAGGKGCGRPRADHRCELRRSPLTQAVREALLPELRVQVGLWSLIWWGECHGRQGFLALFP